MSSKFFLAAMFALAAGAAPLASAATSASTSTYTVDPSHTYPSFEADHRGLSIFRGKFDKTSGTVTLDRAAGTGAVDIVIDAASVDFGNAKMNEHARGDEMFNVAKYPTITYRAKSMTFKDGRPATIDGELTMLGVTKPVKLTVDKFACDIHPMLKREVCGADAKGEFNRADFGMTVGLPKFSPETRLAIQIEAIKTE
ncbi:MAG: YceI family protein [Burkholderiaceae bacterium]